MIDLDDLEAFDDPAPPKPDLPYVHRRASRMRSRNRVAAACVGVAVLALAVVIVAAYPRGAAGRRTITSAPAPSNGQPTTGLHGELTVDTPNVELGNGLNGEITLDPPTLALNDVTATFAVRNDTGATVDLTNDGLDCDFRLRAIRLDSSGILALEGGDDVVCRGVPDRLEPGATRSYPVTLSTTNFDSATQTYHLTLDNGS